MLADNKKEVKHCVGYNASFLLLFCALSKNKNIYIFIFAPFGVLKGGRPAGAGRPPANSSTTAPPAHILEFALLCMAETEPILLRRYKLPFTLIYALKSAILALWQPVLQPATERLEVYFFNKNAFAYFLKWARSICTLLLFFELRLYCRKRARAGKTDSDLYISCILSRVFCLPYYTVFAFCKRLTLQPFLRRYCVVFLPIAFLRLRFVRFAFWFFAFFTTFLADLLPFLVFTTVLKTFYKGFWIKPFTLQKKRLTAFFYSQPWNQKEMYTTLFYKAAFLMQITQSIVTKPKQPKRIIQRFVLHCLLQKVRF